MKARMLFACTLVAATVSSGSVPFVLDLVVNQVSTSNFETNWANSDKNRQFAIEAQRYYHKGYRHGWADALEGQVDQWNAKAPQMPDIFAHEYARGYWAGYQSANLY